MDIQRVKPIIFTPVTIAGFHDVLRKNILWRHHQTQQGASGHPRSAMLKGKSSDRASLPSH